MALQSIAGTNELVFVAVNDDERALLQSMDENERLIFTHVKASDNRGIWLRDLLKNTNLHHGVVTKVLKKLEQRNIIKSVKSVKICHKESHCLLDYIEP